MSSDDYIGIVKDGNGVYTGYNLDMSQEYPTITDVIRNGRFEFTAPTLEEAIIKAQQTETEYGYKFLNIKPETPPTPMERIIKHDTEVTVTTRLIANEVEFKITSRKEPHIKFLNSKGIKGKWWITTFKLLPKEITTLREHLETA